MVLNVRCIQKTFASGPSIEGFMESISGEIDKDLRERGAFIVANNGMID